MSPTNPKYESRNNPSGMTLVEFRERYDYIVRAVVSRYVPYDMYDPDDMSSEIWTQFATGKNGRSYLEIYDPSKGAPTTFMWEFTKLRCLQYTSKLKRTPTARAQSIQPQGDTEVPEPGVINVETTAELGYNEYVHLEFEDLLRRATEAIHRHKQRGKRDLKWVWRLVLAGMQQDQIAQEMQLSEGTISICMGLIREIPEVQELRNWAIEHGLIRDDSYIFA